MKRSYCAEVHLDGGVIKAVCQHRGKTHEGLLIGWEKSTFRTKTVIKPTKINVATLSGLVHPARRGSEALGEEEMAPVCQVTSKTSRRSGGTGDAARSA